jgi:hypothetical protein
MQLTVVHLGITFHYPSHLEKKLLELWVERSVELHLLKTYNKAITDTVMARAT